MLGSKRLLLLLHVRWRCRQLLRVAARHLEVRCLHRGLLSRNELLVFAALFVLLLLQLLHLLLQLVLLHLSL